MTEKHHPASSKAARKRTTRTMRRLERIVVDNKTTQPCVSKQPTGYSRGARIRKES